MSRILKTRQIISTEVAASFVYKQEKFDPSREPEEHNSGSLETNAFLAMAVTLAIPFQLVKPCAGCYMSTGVTSVYLLYTLLTVRLNLDGKTKSW